MEEGNQNSENNCCSAEEYSGVSIVMASGLVSLIVVAVLYVLLRVVRERLLLDIRRNKFIYERKWNL